MANNTKYLETLSANTKGWEYNGYNSESIYFFEDPSQFYNYILYTDHSQAAWQIGFFYITLIFSLQKVMKNKKGLELRGPLFLWNAGLGLFSIFGFIRTFPGLMFAISSQNGFYTSVCLRKYGDVATMFWSIMFTFSKVVEFGDTLFIVLRKRPLIFLQWYHHVATMIYTWAIAMTLMEPIQRWHMVLNFGVHSLMYPYFALRAVGFRVPSYIANLITTCQFLQMIIGTVVNVASIYLQYGGLPCVRYSESIQASFVLYGSFLLLFGKLFVDSVMNKGRAKKLN